jgi:hypothetical protein
VIAQDYFAHPPSTFFYGHSKAMFHNILHLHQLSRKPYYYGSFYQLFPIPDSAFPAILEQVQMGLWVPELVPEQAWAQEQV